MASSDASALSHWRRFFRDAGGADIFQVIEAAVAVAALERPAELKQRRELIAQRLYTAGAHSYGDADDSNKDSISMPIKERRPVEASKQDAAPSPSMSSTKKAGGPVKIHLESKNCSVRPQYAKPTASTAGRDEAPAQQSMEAKLASTKRKLQERYKEHKDAKRQRMIQVVEAPQMARQRRQSQHPIIRRRDEVRCAPTVAERRALMSSLRWGVFTS
jgi:hypothetical protein